MKTKIELATLAYIKRNAKLRLEIAAILTKLSGNEPLKKDDYSAFGNSKESLDAALRYFMDTTKECNQREKEVMNGKEMRHQQAISSYTKWAVRRDKIKFVSDMPCFLYGKDAYIAEAFTELDVRKINESNGIVICTATFGQPIWRYAFVRQLPTSFDITKADIEKKIGYAIEDMKLEPKYENGQCIGLEVTLQPKVAVDHIELNFKVEEPDWRIGSYFFRKTGASKFTVTTSADLYDLVEFGKTIMCHGLTFDEQYNHFIRYFCNGNGFNYNFIDGIAYYKPIKKEPDWRIGSYYFREVSTTLSPTTFAWTRLYELVSFDRGIACTCHPFNEQLDNFSTWVCFGKGYETREIGDTTYYKPKR